MIPGAGTLSRYDPLLLQQINNKPAAGHFHLCVHCITQSQVNCTADARCRWCVWWAYYCIPSWGPICRTGTHPTTKLELIGERWAIGLRASISKCQGFKLLKLVRTVVHVLQCIIISDAMKIFMSTIWEETVGERNMKGKNCHVWLAYFENLGSKWDFRSLTVKFGSDLANREHYMVQVQWVTL